MILVLWTICMASPSFGIKCEDRWAFTSERAIESIKDKYIKKGIKDIRTISITMKEIAHE